MTASKNTVTCRITDYWIGDWAWPYLRVLGDSNYTCGLDGDFSDPELSTWPDDAEKAAKSFAANFHLQYHQYGSLSGFELGGKPVIVVYPLWRIDHHTSGILAEAIVKAGGQAKFVNSFNLARAPGTTYRKLAV